MGLTPTRGRIVIITGGRGAGKTRLCLRLAERARAYGWRVAGAACPAVFQAGEKTGIAVQDLRSGETRRLAQRLTPGSAAQVRTEGWAFDPDGLDWGNRLFASAAPCDLLVVDELGPLELVRGEGWQAALEALAQGGYCLALVVVRPELLDVLPAAWHIQRVVDLDCQPAGD